MDVVFGDDVDVLLHRSLSSTTVMRRSEANAVSRMRRSSMTGMDPCSIPKAGGQDQR